jgi:hypothetical protein
MEQGVSLEEIMVRLFLRRTVIAGGLLIAASVPLERLAAQSAGASRVAADSVPKEFLPPADMCRIWLDGVPATQQPAPTECSLAVRNKPPNGKVIYGPKKAGASGKGLSDVPIKRFDNKATPKPPIKIPGRPDVSDAGREPWESKRVTDEQLYGDRQGNLPVSSSGGFGLPGGGNGTFEAYVGQGGLLMGTGPMVDPRYFSGNAPPPGRGSTTCLDRDSDGWCDDFRFGPPPCLDRDKDGRCDDLPAFASQPYPQVLPRMQAAVDVVQGRASVEVAQWLGTNEFVARLPDQGRGTPWRAIFLDANSNQLMQVWTDRDKDGLVDRVEVFRDGQRVKLIQR